MAKYQRTILKDPAYGPDWREFYAWLNHFEEDWLAPLESQPPRRVTVRVDGALEPGAPIAWGGRRRRLYGADRSTVLKQAFAAVCAEHPTWKAQAIWDELATVVNASIPKPVWGLQLADLARGRHDPSGNVLSDALENQHQPVV